MNNTSIKKTLLDTNRFMAYGNKKNDITLTIMYTVVFLFVVIANLALLFGMIKIRRRNIKTTRADFMISFVSLCDLLEGALMMPVQIYLINKTGDTSKSDVIIKTTIQIIVGTMSGTSIVLISNDRYLFLTNPKFHKKYITKSMTMIAISTQMIITILWTSAFLYVSQQNSNKQNAMILLAYGFFQSALLLEVIFINICLQRNIKCAARCTELYFNSKCTIYQNRVTKTILIISILLVIAYTPSCCGTFIAAAINWTGSCELISRTINLLPWIFLPSHLNSGANAAISIWRNNSLKKYYKTTFFKKLL